MTCTVPLAVFLSLFHRQAHVEVLQLFSPPEMRENGDLRAIALRIITMSQSH